MRLDFLESFGEESISSQGIALDVSRDSLGEKKFIINTPRVFQKLGGNPENIVRNKRIYERMLQQEAS